MKPFQFLQPHSIDEALRSSTGGEATWLAGGTTLVDLMKLNVLTPAKVVSIKPLLDAKIEEHSDRIYVGAGSTMAQVADHAMIKEHAPMVRQSLILAASPQIRNMATIAGNLLQRTRFPYFRHIDFPDVKSGQTIEGELASAQTQGIDCSMMAILGHNGRLAGTYPGDFGAAFVTANGTVHVRGENGERMVAAREFFSPPQDTAEYKTALRAGELIIGLSLPKKPVVKHSLYLKIRERSSYAFALASVAVGLQLEGQGSSAKVVDVCVGLGGVATIPWSSPEAEKIMRGRPATDALFVEAAEAAFSRAVAPEGMQWKVTLAKRVLVRGLQMLRDQGVPSDRDIWSFQHGRDA